MKILKYIAIPSWENSPSPGRTSYSSLHWKRTTTTRMATTRSRQLSTRQLPTRRLSRERLPSTIVQHCSTSSIQHLWSTPISFWILIVFQRSVWRQKTSSEFVVICSLARFQMWFLIKFQINREIIINTYLFEQSILAHYYSIAQKSLTFSSKTNHFNRRFITFCMQLGNTGD